MHPDNRLSFLTDLTSNKGCHRQNILDQATNYAETIEMSVGNWQSVS